MVSALFTVILYSRIIPVLKRLIYLVERPYKEHNFAC